MAFQTFAMGLHALQDATSPAHSGFQEWSGEESFWEQIKHVSVEILYPGENSHLQKITNQYLDWFLHSNEPLPSGNLFDTINSD